jgi:hypothetical protein
MERRYSNMSDLKSYFDWELQFRKLPGEKILPEKINSLGIPELDFKKIMDKYKKND